MPVTKKSPLAPDSFPDIKAVPGVHFGAVAAGLRYRNRPDLMLAMFSEDTRAAGVFTRSKMPAAPVDWSRDALASSGGKARALVVNAGNANAFTGKRGTAAAEETARITADIAGCSVHEVLLASTGVIGQPLDVSSFAKYLNRIHAGLSATMWHEAATAIATTDTFPKGASATAVIDGMPVVVSAIAKGSGMIAPDMATMLGFVFTNANITSSCLHTVLSRAVMRSFNSITVDGDTSTNDTVFAFATGEKANAKLISDPDDPRLADFVQKFDAVLINLAQQIIKDGEGATKFVTITVKGAENDKAALIIAKSIANSPLVKTAIAGEDPNWGRIVMAVGKSGELADRDALKLWIGDQKVAENGAICRSYSEDEAAAHMKTDTIMLTVDVGVGDGVATVWTCDLTHGYIDINADYRS